MFFFSFFELLLIIKRQSLAHGSVSFAALLGMFMVCLHLPCDDLVMAAFGISTLLPFATRIAEEICGVQLRATRSALAVSEDKGRFSMAHLCAAVGSLEPSAGLC